MIPARFCDLQSLINNNDTEKIRKGTLADVGNYVSQTSENNEKNYLILARKRISRGDIMFVTVEDDRLPSLFWVSQDHERNMNHAFDKIKIDLGSPISYDC